MRLELNTLHHLSQFGLEVGDDPNEVAFYVDGSHVSIEVKPSANLSDEKVTELVGLVDDLVCDLCGDNGEYEFDDSYEDAEIIRRCLIRRK